MDSLKVVLIANRGEIAVRIIKTAKRLGVKTIAIYTEPDSASSHVSEADEAYLLEGEATKAYLDENQIIAIAKRTGTNAIIPGYGFLSENTEFAGTVLRNGIQFVGPSSESIESFGLKHTARELAIKAGVPIVPGTRELLQTEEEAVSAANELGYPIMLKATAGGGGMGLLTCENEQEVRASFQTVQSRGAALFKNAGVFMEKFYPAAHHIEVQVFGNGLGKVIAVGERECSVQRRHQKVIEEAPSPFVQFKHPELRKKLTSAAVRLASSINYASAGTIEYLVDDETGDFFFLEMNTRLQVEHGITEMCYGVDLVELMLLQADAQIAGKGGIDAEKLDALEAGFSEPKGHAIEVRVYAENPARNYAPAPGLLQGVSWHCLAGTRVDTWVRAGITVSPSYDPLLAKILHHSPSREQAVEEMTEVLSKSVIYGPPTNLDFLLAIIKDETYRSGHTITSFLNTFDFLPPAIDIISGGSYTLIQDYPGRPTIGRGFGHAGPMDPIAFQVANSLVGNAITTEALEITLAGPELLFLGDAVVSLCGAAIAATLDGVDLPMWTTVQIKAGSRLAIGKTLSNAGCRSYLAVYGGFLNVAEWFGSKATCPMVNVGGYQGRPLRAGDLLRIVEGSELPKALPKATSIPETLWPQYSDHWDIHAMPGPYDEGYLLPEDLEMLYGTTWEVSHNSARGGIRLVGPRPKWARTDGGDGGSHPSNVIEYGYPMGGLNWTGDEPVIFPVDCPDFGGFICSLTVIKGDYSKVGQLRAGNTVRFHQVSLEEALEIRQKNDAYIASLTESLTSGLFDGVAPFDSKPIVSTKLTHSILRILQETESRPKVTYRQGADDYLLVDYANGFFDLNHKCRATALDRVLKSEGAKYAFGKQGPLLSTIGVGNSLMIYYNGLKLPQAELLDYLIEIEDGLGDMRAISFPNRTFKLPLSFDHKKLRDAIARYTENQRPHAPYLPDPFKFVADNNGITVEELKKLWLTAEFIVVGVGFLMALPEALPADPRMRLNAPKMNPSRTFTPAGTASLGGSCLAIYNVDSPGGFMPTGMTIPGVDALGYKEGFSPERPWLFEPMDVITFYEVTEEEYDQEMAIFQSGRYSFKIETSVFDMKAHNELLVSTADEVAALKVIQKEAQDRMGALDRISLDKWTQEKAAVTVPYASVQTLLDGEIYYDPQLLNKQPTNTNNYFAPPDPDIQIIEAPLNANVWKVLVSDGEILKKGQVVTILEAMKMEINVVVDDKLEGAKIEMVLMKPNDIVHAGKPLILARLP
ncbi:putative urea amidolyase [Xylariales sp. PMI_506]|nr:putative urea amidolyase [Xylariales sp. PMI_506]